LWFEDRLDYVSRFTVAERVSLISLSQFYIFTCRWEFAWGYPGYQRKGQPPSELERRQPWHETVSYPGAASKPVCVVACGATNLEFLPSVGIQGPIVVENVKEGKIMTDSNFVVVSIMCRSNLDSSRTELHVDDYRVRDNRESAIDKWVDGKFTMKVLQIIQTGSTQRNPWVLTVYLESSGCTAIAVSPSMVSGRVVAMIIFSSVKGRKRNVFTIWRYSPDPSMG
jgi:hypothetical protein